MFLSGGRGAVVLWGTVSARWWAGCDTGGVSLVPGRVVTLLTRGGCGACAVALGQLEGLRSSLSFALDVVDVDAAAGLGDAGLRAEFGDRLPVVLLDGEEHSYWDVDVDGLRAELAR